MLIYNMMIVKSGTVDIHDIDVVETQSFYLEKGQPINCLEITLLWVTKPWSTSKQKNQ